MQNITPQNVAQAIEYGFQRLQAGDWVAAGQIGEQILKAGSNHPDAWVLLCMGLVKSGSKDDVRALERGVSAIAEDHPASLLLSVELARASGIRGKMRSAVELARKLSTHPHLNPRQRDSLAQAASQGGDFALALSLSQSAVAALPNDALVWHNYGMSLRYSGDLVASRAALEKALKLNPALSVTAYALADSAQWSAKDNHIDQCRAQAQAAARHLSNTPSTEAGIQVAQWQFALYKELEDCGRDKEAIDALLAGCAAMRSVAPYDTQGRHTHFSNVIKETAASVAKPKARKNKAGPNMPRVIFVIGLPRSGTTLVEQILSVHPKITAMGETQGGPLSIIDTSELSPTSLETIAQAYWRVSGHLAGTKPFATDKLPNNYEIAGILARAFPDALFVHLRRAPMDSLFGALKTLFGEGAYRWSYSLDDLAEAYRQYRRLTDHWRATFGPRMVDITLEELIAAPEPQIRALLEGLGLEFQEACLSPEKSAVAVSTASSVQIRKPINASGVGRWKRYREQLEPLRAALEADGFVDSNGDPV
jgi:tetratricopeptide (TPR) repeat protein